MEQVTLPSTARVASTANPPLLGRRAEDLFRRSAYLALRNLTCVDSGGVLTLSGQVSSYYLKQVAQEIAARVEGVRVVINAIEVHARAAISPADPGWGAGPRPRPSPWLASDPASIREI
jgi:hypothetical protein